jgi:rubrerythrin
MDIIRIFQYALQREIEGKQFFEENAGRLAHASAVEIFKKLAEEEQKHINYIQAHIEAIEGGTAPHSLNSVTNQDNSIFSQRAQSEMIEQTIAEAMVPDLPVLRMAYLIERDFAEFYEQAASKTSGKEKEALELLAKWERMHEQIFKDLHDQAFEHIMQMPWGG